MVRSVFVSLVSVSLLALSACSRTEPPATPVRAVKLYTVGASEAGGAAQEYAADIRAQTESRLGFQVPGKLQQRLVQAGQQVRAGQLLAVLDPQDYQSQAQAAVAQLAAAKSQRDLAAADLKRYQALRAQGFISAAELERHQVTLDAAEAGLKQAQAQASVQGNQAAYTRLLADADGVIVGTDAEPGQVLSAGATVVRLARNGPRDAVFSVPEDRARELKLGQAVKVQPWSQGGQSVGLQAQVRELAPSADPVTRTFVVKAALANSQTLALGSTATVFVLPVVSAERHGLSVPMSAVWQQGQGSAVWVYEAASGVVKARTVQVSRMDGAQATIASGLKEGEEVVAAGTHVLTEGLKVTRYQPAAADTTTDAGSSRP